MSSLPRVSCVRHLLVVTSALARRCSRVLTGTGASHPLVPWGMPYSSALRRTESVVTFVVAVPSCSVWRVVFQGPPVWLRLALVVLSAMKSPSAALSYYPARVILFLGARKRMLIPLSDMGSCESCSGRSFYLRPRQDVLTLTIAMSRILSVSLDPGIVLYCVGPWVSCAAILSGASSFRHCASTLWRARCKNIFSIGL